MFVSQPYHTDPRNNQCDKQEVAIQASFRSKMRMDAPHIMLVGIPNSGKRTAWEARERSKEGMVPGFPDMLAFHDGRVAALEFKTGKGSLSDKQKDTLNRLVRQRIPVGVFRSPETAYEWLSNLWPSAFQ